MVGACCCNMGARLGLQGGCGTGTRAAVAEGPRSGPVSDGFCWWSKQNLLPDWVQVVREKSWMAPRVLAGALTAQTVFN